MAKIAKVALPLAVDKIFDYQIPKSCRLRPGMRVRVDFKSKKLIGIAVSLAGQTQAKTIKTIEEVLDSTPILKNIHLRFAKKLAACYPYPLSQFLFAMIPPVLRKGKALDVFLPEEATQKHLSGRKPLFIKSAYFRRRYPLWRKQAKAALREGSVVICLPQHSYLKKAGKTIKNDFSRKVFEFSSQKTQKETLKNWLESRQKSLILGTRSALFYSPPDTKLVIIEEETSPYYFQEVKPFYHLRKVASVFRLVSGAGLILSGSWPSLYTYEKIKKRQIKLTEVPEKRINKVKVISRNDFQKNKYINPILLELIRKAVSDKKKSVVIWNKKHFARIIYCGSCNESLRCPDCSGFLQQAEKSKDKLLCPYCQKTSRLPQTCPQCGSSSLIAKGMGIKKLQEILERFFPEISVSDLESYKGKARLILSTAGILNLLYGQKEFDRGFALDADSCFSQPDFSATFEAFIYLKNLASLFKDKLFVFTSRPQYYLFRLINKNWHDFYNHELSLRRQMSLPPYTRIIKITLRDRKQNQALKKSEKLYNILNCRKYLAFGPFAGLPHKLRGKYRYSLIVKTKQKAPLKKDFLRQLKKIKTGQTQAAVILK